MNRKQRRARRDTPLAGYGTQARNLFPDYITHGAPCDICGTPINGDSRTLSWLTVDGKRFSLLIRTCRRHTACTIAELLADMPEQIRGSLPPMDGAYMRHDSGDVPPGLR